MKRGNSVTRVEKSSAKRCVPMPKIVRLDCSSETMNRGLVVEKGTTFEGSFIETTVAACFGDAGAEIAVDWVQGTGVALSPAQIGGRRFVIGGFPHSC